MSPFLYPNRLLVLFSLLLVTILAQSPPHAAPSSEPVLLEAKTKQDSPRQDDDSLKSLEDAIAKLEKADKSFPSIVFSNGRKTNSDWFRPPSFPGSPLPPGAPKPDFFQVSPYNPRPPAAFSAAVPPPKTGGVVPQFVTNRDSDCIFELDGLSYNLNPLRLPPGHSEYVSMDAARMTYKMNFCGLTTAPVRTRQGELVASDCERSNGMICQYDQGPAPILEVIARWGAAPYPVWAFIDDNFRDAGVKLTFRNGDDCSFRGVKKTREAIVNFVCDRNVDRMGKIATREVSTCTYIFTVPTPLACLSAASSSGGGWWFVFVVLAVAIVYFGGGIAYNHIKHQKNGLEAIPHLEFWKDLPALVKDGCAFTWSKVACYTCRQSKPAGDDL